MFGPIEDAPRTPAGGLRNPWVETAFAALATTLAVAQIEVAHGRAEAQFLRHKMSWLAPFCKPVTDVAVAKHNEAVAARMAEGASMDDPALRPQIFQDLDLAQKLAELGKWGQRD